MHGNPALQRRAWWFGPPLLCLSLLCPLLWASNASSADARTAPPEITTELPGARLQGEGQLRFFGMAVYRARLWVNEDFDTAQPTHHPLALELIYSRRLTGRLIAERSLTEMRRSGEVSNEQAERWLAAMTEAFPDVQAGDRITGINHPGRTARFQVNGRFKAEIADPVFAQRFFGIWLSPQSSEPALRQQLLGNPPAQ